MKPEKPDGRQVVGSHQLLGDSKSKRNSRQVGLSYDDEEDESE